MAARFWVGGTGNWDGSSTAHWAATSGGASGASVPTSADDVTFDSNSGATATITITGATAVANTVTINKSDLTVVLNANMTVTNAMTLTTGTLNTNGNTCSWGSFVSSNSNTRALSLGASSITCTSATLPWSMAVSTNMTLTPGTSSITISANGPNTVACGGLTYYDLTISTVGNGNVNLSGVNTFHNLTVLGSASKNGSLSLANQTVTNLLTLTGNSAINQLTVMSTAVGTQRTLTVNAAVISNITFQDIRGAGTAAPFTGSNMGDALGNANVNFDSPLTLYRVGVGGNWSASQWSLTSGGTADQRVPLPQDIIFIDSGASGTISIDMPFLGKDIDLTGFAGTLASTVSTSIYGNLVRSDDPAAAFSGTNNLIFSGRSANTITSRGKTFTQAINISAVGGSYTLQDNLTVSNNLTLTLGTLNANNHNVSVNAFLSSNNGNSRTLNMGDGTWSVNGTGVVWNVTSNGSLVITPGNSTISITDTGSSSKTFTGNGRTYGNIHIVAGGSGAVLFTGANVCKTLTINAPKTVTLPAGVTTTVSSLVALGSSGNVITINSSSAGSAATLSKTSGIISGDYLSLQDSTAGGGAQWYAGSHSTNVSNNTGWIFQDVPVGSNRFFQFFD